MFLARRLTKSLLSASILGVVTAFAACSEPTAPPKVNEIVVVSLLDTMAVGATSQLGANVLGVTGSVLSGVPVQWASTEPLVASVSSSGLVTALSAGSTTITATAGGITRGASIVVKLPNCGAPVGGALSLGGSRSANMATNACLLFGHFTAVGFPLTMPSAGGVALSASVSGFPAGIFITDNSNEYIAGNVFGGANPRLREQLSAGSYRVWVTSDSAARASHTFTLSAAAAGGRCEDGTVTRTTTLGTEASAALSDNSCLLLEGPVAEGWRLTLTEPATIRVVATATAFAPMVAVTAADYSEIVGFGVAEGAGPASMVTPLAAGEYLVWGGSFLAMTGTVHVRAEIVAPRVASGVLALGASVNGVLLPTDCNSLRQSSSFADVWTFTLTDTTSVRFDLISSMFDTYLELRSAQDVLITADDDGGEGLNSQIVRSLPPGTYRLWATSYDGAVTGPYTLSANSVTGGAVREDRPPQQPSGLSSPAEKRVPAPMRRPWPRPRTS